MYRNISNPAILYPYLLFLEFKYRCNILILGKITKVSIIALGLVKHHSIIVIAAILDYTTRIPQDI